MSGRYRKKKSDQMDEEEKGKKNSGFLLWFDRQIVKKEKKKIVSLSPPLLVFFFSIKLCTHIFESIETVFGGSQGLVQDPQQQWNKRKVYIHLHKKKYIEDLYNITSTNQPPNM